MKIGSENNDKVKYSILFVMIFLWLVLIKWQNVTRYFIGKSNIPMCCRSINSLGLFVF